MIVPLENVLPELPPTRVRYVAGLSTFGNEPIFSVHRLTEHYDPATGEARGRLATETIPMEMSEEQARHLAVQLSAATGLTAEHDLALGILKANLQEAQDALRAITKMLEHGDAE